MGLLLLSTGYLAILSLCALLQYTEAVYVCDTTCQQSQRAALLDLYQATKGSSWYLNTWWGLPNSGWGSEGNVSSGLPAHCSWAWVFCCGADGYVYLDPSIPWTVDVQCNTFAGVTILILADNNLTGTLPQDADSWAPFARTLSVMELTGD